MNVEEVLAKYTKPTTYETEHGLAPRGSWVKLLDADDVKFYARDAHDWTKTLLIIFRAGITDNWCGWMINEQQARVMMNDFPGLYGGLNDSNNLRRQGRQPGIPGESADDFTTPSEGGVEY